MKRIPFSEMIGMRFGRYEVLEIIKDDNSGKSLLKCKCDCGTIKSLFRWPLVSGRIKSCGCLKLDQIKLRFTTHGETKGGNESSTYQTWKRIKDRCNNPNNKDWCLYGGRGIKMCPQWENSFEQFLIDVGRKPGHQYSIERINSDGNYEQGNVKWATAKEQSRNTSQVRFIEYNGKVQCLADWAIELGFSYRLLSNRLNLLKWPVEKAFTTPILYDSSKNIDLSKNPLCPDCQCAFKKNGKSGDRQRFICINHHRFFDKPGRIAKDKRL